MHGAPGLSPHDLGSQCSDGVIPNTVPGITAESLAEELAPGPLVQYGALHQGEEAEILLLRRQMVRTLLILLQLSELLMGRTLLMILTMQMMVRMLRRFLIMQRSVGPDLATHWMLSMSWLLN